MVYSLIAIAEKIITAWCFCVRLSPLPDRLENSAYFPCACAQNGSVFCVPTLLGIDVCTVARILAIKQQIPKVLIAKKSTLECAFACNNCIYGIRMVGMIQSRSILRLIVLRSYTAITVHITTTGAASLQLQLLK